MPVLFVLAVIVSLFKPTTDSLNQVARKIETRLNNIESLFEESARNAELHKELAYNNESGEQIERLEKSGLLLYYYDKDSLVHWTSNSVLPPLPHSTLAENTALIKLKNGWYQMMTFRDSVNHQTLVGLYAVRWEYPYENKFLKNEFALGLNIPHNIEISEQKLPGSVPVRNLKGETIFTLYVTGDEKGEDINLILFIAQLILIIALFYFIHWFSTWVLGRYGFGMAFSGLFVLLIIVRALIFWIEPVAEFSRLDLFNPKYYASSAITPSLGDLIINTALIFWLVLFGEYYKKNWQKHLESIALFKYIFITLIFVFSGLVTWTFKSLVMDSVISFEIYNILNLNFYSLLGLICIAALLIAHFLISRIIISHFKTSGASLRYGLLFAVICCGIYILFAIGSPFYHVILFSAIWSVAFLVILYVVITEPSSLPVRALIIYISLYCILSTFLIENLYERKERNQRRFFASRLVSERDFVAEFMFDDIASRISKDPFIRSYFTNPQLTKREITGRISSIYLSGYFNKYDLKVSTFDKHGNGIKNRDTTSLRHFYDETDSDIVQQQKLYYIPDTTQNYSYVSFFKFQEDSNYLGELVVHLIPKVYYGRNVYPELLLGENISNVLDNSRYSYAVYRNDKMIMQHGDCPYSYYWNKDFQFGDKQYVYIDEGDWEHLIYRFSNNMKDIVTDKQEGLFEPVATFSYMFSFYFIVAFLAILIYHLGWRNESPGYFFNGFSISFRTRINYSMLIMILISFIIIGFTTMSFFTRQYHNFYTDRLLHKEKILHAGLEYFVQQNNPDNEPIQSDRLGNALSFEIARLADINDIDLNLYDESGNLVVASQSAIYDKGLISRKINPDAYFDLVSEKIAQVTEQEAIGGLSYMAIYAAIRNTAGETIGYVGVPYFEGSRDISDDISSLLVALMNVYVFLLICAAVLAYFISNSITRPLTIIGDKLRILNLNKKNEPIEWKSRDEIGVLVEEYNKMIQELEHSAIKLARSERDSAWREMAKQIAHEIKNPLTPMKLSIQYLQRAIAAGDSNITELSGKVARTLEEQIENLSSIATAFSSFAKMPKAQNEIINLNELLKSIADLFNREERITVSFNSDTSQPIVFADKNQLVSVFNNLVKNAMQSIPENRTGFVDVHVKENEGWIIITVSDNGSGIPKNNYEKVFVPNFTTKSSGTGLGLAISRQIIDGSGGEIWFESRETVGTTFSVKLKKSEEM